MGQRIGGVVGLEKETAVTTLAQIRLAICKRQDHWYNNNTHERGHGESNKSNQNGSTRMANGRFGFMEQQSKWTFCRRGSTQPTERTKHITNATLVHDPSVCIRLSCGQRTAFPSSVRSGTKTNAVNRTVAKREGKGKRKSKSRTFHEQ